jgi:hypothetical protein
MPSPKETLIERVDRAKKRELVAVVHPPLAGDEISVLEARCGGALHVEIKDLVEYAGGLTLNDIVMDFAGREPFEFEAFPRALPIATDGKGNFWVIDIVSRCTWRAVTFIADDPPVVMLQARDVGSFIEQVFDTPDAERLKNEHVSRIWKENLVIPRARALASQDFAIRSFAQQFDDRFVIADLHEGERGQGFAWGIAGPNTEIHRAGDDLLFAIEQKKRGVLTRFFHDERHGGRYRSVKAS